jgi:hypothetical protein
MTKAADSDGKMMMPELTGRGAVFIIRLRFDPGKSIQKLA